MRHFWGSVTNRLSRLLLGLGLALGTHAAQADAITEVGFFSRDDDVRLLGLSVTTPGLVSATSIGYAGGTTVGGTTIPRGGFDTALFLYSSAGVLLAQSDDGIGVPTDPTTGLASDAALSITLAAGGYILALTQFDNFALGMLSAGFSRSGDGTSRRACRVSARRRLSATRRATRARRTGRSISPASTRRPACSRSPSRQAPRWFSSASRRCCGDGAACRNGSIAQLVSNRRTPNFAETHD